MLRISKLLRPALALRAAILVLAVAAPAVALEPTVVVISLDGTRSAALHIPGLRTLPALARGGAAAERLIPVLPTNTFPNHVTLVTGVAPATHGMVNNVFLDPEKGLHRKSGEPGWIDVAPIWTIAERHGVVSAALHWVGSEGNWRDAPGPTHWRAFDASMREGEKVDQILAWLAMEDPGQRPHLVTSWFHGADGAGHRTGPDSDAVAAALRDQDAELGRLVATLRERGAFAHTTLFVVSDHGMAAVEHRIDLAAALRDAELDARVFGAGGFVTVWISGGSGAARRARAVARGLGLEAFLRGEAPAELGLSNPRFGDLVVLAPLGTSIETSGGEREKMMGAHGYRPETPAMGALFVAHGRGVRPGTQLSEVRALDIAPTVLALLGIERPAWMQGRPIPELLVIDAGATAPDDPSGATP